MRLTTRDRSYILRCALADRNVAWALEPPAQPLTFKEVKRLIKNGYLGSGPTGYRPTTLGMQAVQMEFNKALASAGKVDVQ